MTDTDIKYDSTGRIESAHGFSIHGDKHAYECSKCGAIFQSKNIECRSIFPTNDPRCKDCDWKYHHEYEDLRRICKCEPIIKY